MQLSILVTFIAFLTLFVFIGLLSFRAKQSTASDYLLASRDIAPWTMALSMVSTNNSGWMFIGFIGALYVSGLSAAWLIIGWIVGDLLVWLLAFRQLRERTESLGAKTIPQFISHINNKESRLIRCLCGLLTLIFLSVYAAAQLKAGSKALYIVFSWQQDVGAIIGAFIILLYCMAGGIRASIWTDTVQAMLMMVAMILLLLYGLMAIGGMHELAQLLNQQNPQLLSWYPANASFGFILYLISWVAAGVGVIGQPHIVIRAFVLKRATDMKLAGILYFTWYIAFALLCVGVGLCARALLPHLLQGDVELALPQLAYHLFPGFFIGITLAGIFAATISTADSQILSCSAALSQDLFPGMRNNYQAMRLMTVLITIVTLLIALFSHQSVFVLVVLAWSILAVTLAPLMIIQACRLPLNITVALLMMLAGLITALTWRYGFDFASSVYDVLPGMSMSFILYALYYCGLKYLRKVKA